LQLFWDFFMVLISVISHPSKCSGLWLLIH
jgi:hypothetical protein